jgi:hypothetical protein
LHPVIIGAFITGSLALAGAVGAAFIATRTRPGQASMGRRSSEAVMLVEIMIATTRAVVLAALGGIVGLAVLALALMALAG